MYHMSEPNNFMYFNVSPKCNRAGMQAYVFGFFFFDCHADILSCPFSELNNKLLPPAF